MFDFEKIFDQIITEGRITKKEEIVPGITVEVRALSVGETISAEAMAIASNKYAAIDVIQRVRGLSLLSRALVSINGVEIIDNPDHADYREAREKLYEKLSNMPNSVIDSMYKLFLDVSREQSQIYEGPEKFNEELENF